MENEIWKPVLGYEGYYEASSEGNIYSRPRKGTKGGMMKQTLSQSNGGYLMVHLCSKEKDDFMLVSHVIWEAFNGPIPDGYEINHINEDKTDNRLCNINLMTRKVNCNWGTRNERLVNNRKGYGKKQPIIQYDLQGSVIEEFGSLREASRKTGINSGEISKCARGLIPNTGGYRWKYKEKEQV